MTKENLNGQNSVAANAIEEEMDKFLPIVKIDNKN